MEDILEAIGKEN